MGCTATKPRINSASAERMAKEHARKYQRQSEQYLQDLNIKPRMLVPENYRDGYISVSQFYNYFHGGLCGPYIRNPNYMLIVDFRTTEEFNELHILTSLHHKSVRWDCPGIELLKRYSIIVFYDHDGTLAANILSPLTAAYNSLISSQVDVCCVLGGIQAVQNKFPHLVTSPKKSDLSTTKSNTNCDYLNVNKEVLSTKEGRDHLDVNGDVKSSTKDINRTHSKESSTSKSGSSSSTIPFHSISSTITNGDIDKRRTMDFYTQRAAISYNIPWMPTLVHHNGIFLGKAEQAEDPRVYSELGLTHVLSIGRSPQLRLGEINYMGLDGEKNLYYTFLKATEFIQSAVEEHGKILVHGIEGLNRSAAVVTAYLMSSATCILEEAQFYLSVLRPHLQMDENSYECLLEWEKALFGIQLTELEDMWFY